jgi:RNA polymerase sigma-70 factor, ECF subfamily
VPIPSPGLRLEEVTEPVVIAMAASGNSDAFAELMRRRQAGVRRFMRQLCRNPDLADDLAQQVFLRTWRSLRKLKSLDAFNGWLKRIMVSVWIDEIRRQRTDVRGTAPLSEELEEHVRLVPGLERDLEWALSFLEPRTRLCVLLAYGEGNSHSEIAALLSIPLGTAKSLVTRGADTMRSLLGDYQTD